MEASWTPGQRVASASVSWPTRTGLTPAVLRTWENRFGFPAGERSPTGHRRFSEVDVELVRQVLEVRESGVASPGRHRCRTPPPGAGRRRLGPRRPVARVPAPRRPPARTAGVARRFARRRGRGARPRRPPPRAGHLPGGPQVRPLPPPLGRAGAHGVVGRGRGRVRPGPPCRPLGAAGPVPAARALAPAPGVDGGHASAPRARRGRLGVGGAERPGGAPVYESVISTHRPAALAAARVLVDVARASGATPPASATALLDEPAHGPATAAVDADRMWLRALARMDPPGVRPERQWWRSASISSSLVIDDRPSMSSSAARSRSSSTVRSS